MIDEMLINPLARFMFDNSVFRDTLITVEHVYRKYGTAEIKAKLG